MRILVTGGGGMVGRNLLEHPSIGDFEILSPDRTELDLRNFAAVEHYLARHQPDMVVHCAGRVGGIQANLKEPVAFLVENLDIGRNVILAARNAGIKRLLNLGSSCMYPRNRSAPLRERSILAGKLEPSNEGYALAKIVSARLCEYISSEDAAFEYKTLIPCNIFGRYDKFDPARSHLVPAIIHKIWLAKETRQEAVDIWGDGLARREFMYAGDLADALVEAIRRFESLPMLMNIGVGRDYTINQYYQVVSDVIGYRGSFVHDLGRPVGMARKLVSIEKQMLWKWAPRTDLRVGIEETYKFYLMERNNGF